MNSAAWPVELRGVTESIVATLGPNGRWNFAALGLHAPKMEAEPGTAEESSAAEESDTAEGPVTARTYGRTRTCRNFSERGGGVVQFTVDPRAFVDAALTVYEADDRLLPSADAWVEVTASEVDREAMGGTTVRTWALDPGESAVRMERVPTINRGFGAVVDAAVAASRLDVPSAETAALLDRLRYAADVVDRCGGPAEREAFARIDEATGWRGRGDDTGSDDASPDDANDTP
ncbi:DUF447 domain-containing protein [Halorubrum sp. SY-15]|uniref:DUF447 domain-containing protein n=1 Tax=Halorubrum sp. SY-15 TaxID=3402277 RepID=UPI003EB69ABE